jgi:hypothetical protein
MCTKSGSEIVKGGEHLEDICVGGRIVLKWMLNKCGVIIWTGFIWLKMVACREHGNELSVSMRGGIS